MGWWWSTEMELAALCAEIGHANIVATVAAAGAKKLPEPFVIPRPEMDGGSEPEPVVEKPAMSLQSIRAVMTGGGMT